MEFLHESKFPQERFDAILRPVLLDSYDPLRLNDINIDHTTFHEQSQVDHAAFS